jgi:VIT1/CCC1 family predicted Fe2+/Mn2+ transporter
MNQRNSTQSDVRRWRELLASERDAASLYSRLADAESGERQQIFRDLAAIELKHAAHWESKLRTAGESVPAPGGPSLRTRLMAGSFSMAAGEYISMSSQREMDQREISLERAELAEKPDEERSELVLIYRAKGLSRPDAERLADKIMSDREVALDTLAREELGLDPGELGSPWVAAVSSLFAFAIGAFVVVLPYLAGSGTAALGTAIGLALAAMFGVGATIGALNGRSAIRMGLRQMLVGALAAAVTYGVGHLIGAHVS